MPSPTITPACPAMTARLKQRLVQFALWFARTRLGGFVMGTCLETLSPWLPVQRVGETEHVIAFYHPCPAYDIHILIVPKKRIPDMLAFTDETLVYAQHALVMAQRLVRELDLEGRGYRFLVNGGAYQDVKQVHFHLIADAE